MVDVNDVLLNCIPPLGLSFPKNRTSSSTTQHSYMGERKNKSVNSVESKQDDREAYSGAFPDIDGGAKQRSSNQQIRYQQKLEINSEIAENMIQFGYTDNGYVELVMGDNCYKECTVFKLTEWAMLKTIVIGKACFTKSDTSFEISACPCLEELRVGKDSFKEASICLESKNRSEC